MNRSSPADSRMGRDNALIRARNALTDLMGTT